MVANSSIRVVCTMVSHKNYNLSVNEGCVIFVTSKLIACFIDGFTSKKISRLIAYLLHGNEHIYWTLDLEGEVHSRGDFWISAFKNARTMVFSKSGGPGTNFQSGPENLHFFLGTAPAHIYLPRKARKGRFNVPRT